MEQTVASVATSPGAEVRIQVSEFKHRHYLHARQWYTPSGEVTLRPGKGLSIPIELLPWLRAALEEAETLALEKGLLPVEAYDDHGLALPTPLTGG